MLTHALLQSATKLRITMKTVCRNCYVQCRNLAITLNAVMQSDSEALNIANVIKLFTTINDKLTPWQLCDDDCFVIDLTEPF